METGKSNQKTSSEADPKKPEASPPASKPVISAPKENTVNAEKRNDVKSEKPESKPANDIKLPRSAPDEKDAKPPPLKDISKDTDTKLHKDDVSPGDNKTAAPPVSDKDAPAKPPVPPTTETILRARPFMIKTIRVDGTEAGVITGSILSQSLDKMMSASGHTDVGTLTLAGLRKLVPGMSRFAALEKFCTPSGVLVDDEGISFLDYLKLETSAQETPATSAPSVRLYFGPTKGGKALDASQTPAAKVPNLAEGPQVQAPTKPDATLLPKEPAVTKSLITAPNSGSGSTRPGAGMLKEDEWAVVLRNCAVFNGWIIDPQTKRIMRAPKPAFQLRSKVNQEPVAKIPDYVSAGEGTPRAETGSQYPENQGSQDAGMNGLNAITPKSELGIPNFRVNDDSRIEITAHEDELTVSMAKSDFSDQSTSVSVSGGGYGVSVGVSAGYASSKSNSSKKTGTTSTSTLVGRYMFPRCDILLWPDEMEPTPELAGLLDTIRRTKSIKALRKLQAEYGQLFCQQVTLGGRLLSTKIVTTKSQTEIEEKKESFKVSVGASVSASVGGFSASTEVKHEESKGQAETNETSSRSQNESMVFEAVGGDTILATDPGRWSSTVGSHELWRVINVSSVQYHQVKSRLCFHEVDTRV